MAGAVPNLREAGARVRACRSAGSRRGAWPDMATAQAGRLTGATPAWAPWEGAGPPALPRCAERRGRPCAPGPFCSLTGTTGLICISGLGIAELPLATSPKAMPRTSTGPNIVFDDAEDGAVEGAANTIFFNHGQ